MGNSSFWSRSTTAEKLAQIDGGIECGMSSKQIAMCLGASIKGYGAAVRNFALRHNRHMPTSRHESARRGGTAAGQSNGIRAARRAGKPDCEIVSAFSIFGDKGGIESLFDEVPQ